MATRRQRERKTRQRAWHSRIVRRPTGLPLISVWLDEVNAFIPEPYLFGPAPGWATYDRVMARQRGIEEAEAFNRAYRLSAQARD